MPNDYEQLKEKVGQLEARLREFESVDQLNPLIRRTIVEVVGAVTLNSLSDVNVDGATNGQIIKYNSSTQTWELGSDNIA